MKTRRQKVFAILAACLLCASFFAVPVSAGTTFDVTFETPVPGDYNFFRVGGGSHLNWSFTHNTSWNDLKRPTNVVDVGPSVDPSGASYTFDWVSGNNGIVSFWLSTSKFGLDRFQSSDVVWIDSGVFHLQVQNNEYIQFCHYRFSLRIVYEGQTIGPVIGSTDLQRISLSGLGEPAVSVYYPKMNFTISDSVNGIGLMLCLEVEGSSMNGQGQIITTLQDTYTVHYANGADPNLPTYDEPSSGNVGGLESAEQELIQGSQTGLDTANNSFLAFGDRIRSFSTCFIRISSYLNKITGKIPYFDLMLWISLSLGIYASLLGLAGAIVSAADRKAGREAAAAARTAQNERLARAIERSRKK